MTQQHPQPDFREILPSNVYLQPEVIEVLRAVSQAKREGKRVVLATGVFDLLHAEHKNYLQKAKAVGDVLVVALESDVRVRQLKGEGRPKQPQEERLSAVRALDYVDGALILPEDFSSPVRHEELLSHIQPDIYACSSHSPHQDKKRALVEKYGGRLVVVHEKNHHISTTKMLEKFPKTI